MPITRIYHGDINPSDIARDLIAYYHRGAYQVQQIGRDPQIALQIATRQFQRSGEYQWVIIEALFNGDYLREVRPWILH